MPSYISILIISLSRKPIIKARGAVGKNINADVYIYIYIFSIAFFN